MRFGFVVALGVAMVLTGKVDASDVGHDLQAKSLIVKFQKSAGACQIFCV